MALRGFCIELFICKLKKKKIIVKGRHLKTYLILSYLKFSKKELLITSHFPDYFFFPLCYLFAKYFLLTVSSA